MDDAVARVRADKAKPRRGAKPRRRGLRIALVAGLAVLLAAGGGVAYVWADLNSKFHHEPISDILNTSRPPIVVPTTTPTVVYPGDPYGGRAVNILVMGTDSREGANAGVSADDTEGMMRADTTFIAHVSADRSRIDVVSIPRDTLITIPDCPTQDGAVIADAGWTTGFNAAFAVGVHDGGTIGTGAACALMVVEAMSDVRIDAYMVVDFMGFVEVVNSVGGVDVNLRCAIKSKLAGGLDLPAGVNHLDGMTAVNLARARTGTGLGDGSDLQRINRQHALFNAILAKVYAMNYVADFPKLYSLVGAVLGSVTTDLGANLREIAGFAYSLKDFDSSNIYFTTIPVADVGDGQHVYVLKSQVEPVWSALREDRPLPDSPQATTTPTETPTDTTQTTTAGESQASTPGVGTTEPVVPPVFTIQSERDCE